MSQPYGPPGPGPVLHYNCTGSCPSHTGRPALDLYYTIIVQVHVPAIRAAWQRQDSGWRQMRGGRFCTRQLQQQQQLSFTDVSNNGTASNNYHSRQQQLHCQQQLSFTSATTALPATTVIHVSSNGTASNNYHSRQQLRHCQQQLSFTSATTIVHVNSHGSAHEGQFHQTSSRKQTFRRPDEGANTQVNSL